MKRKKMAMNKTNERIEEDEIAACKTDVKLKVDLKHKQPARAALHALPELRNARRNDAHRSHAHRKLRWLRSEADLHSPVPRLPSRGHEPHSPRLRLSFLLLSLQRDLQIPKMSPKMT